MRLHSKFERVQWPVGHGGFHTGHFKYEKANFRYFFDCGSNSKTGKELIGEKLAATAFDFGVISHFDKDHYSELAKAKNLKKLFLPYMTPVDMVLLALADCSGNKVPLEMAFDGFTVLRQLREKGTRIIMVSGREGSPDDRPLGAPENLQDGLSLRIPSIHQGEMSHEQPVEVLDGEVPLLHFRFFNHRREEAFQTFSQNLKDAIKAKKLLKTDGKPYTSENKFLNDVASADAQVVRRNSKAMQDIYKKTLTDAKLKVSDITPSNLSSLAMLSQTCLKFGRFWHKYEHAIALRAQGSCREISERRDGWMLTGDLELTPNTWPAFYDHYFCELSDCAVFNVPHHGSAISLCEEATAFLAGKFFVMPVEAGDDKHPADALIVRLQRHGGHGQQTVTTAWESMVALESLAHWRRFN